MQTTAAALFDAVQTVRASDFSEPITLLANLKEILEPINFAETWKNKNAYKYDFPNQDISLKGAYKIDFSLKNGWDVI